MKYPELQGLRGIAILAVVLYHLWPTTFFNGFMGVDMFFVLSGFLMIETTLKNKTDGFTRADIAPFWYRRIRRIVPLAVLTVFATWIIVPYKLIITNLAEFTRESFCALLFSTNICSVYFAHHYFEHHYIAYFKHYWSLGVEMQFYLIVPLLFLMLRHWSTKCALFVILPIIIAASIILQTVLLIIGYSNVAFSIPPCRLWQFSGGICAFYIQQFSEELLADRKFAKSNLGVLISGFNTWLVTDSLAIALLFGLFVPVKLDVGYTMVIIVVLTAGVITSLDRGTSKNKLVKSKTWILSNPLLLILGNASYAIYLFHWIIQYMFSIISANYDLNAKLYCFYTCIATGILVHFAIEKPLLSAKHSKTSFFTAIAAAYGMLSLLIITTKEQSIPTHIKEFYDQQASLITNTSAWTPVASSLNTYDKTKLAIYTAQHECQFYNESDYVKSFHDKKYYGAELRGNGNLSILVIGNSHAKCSFVGIDAALGKEGYKELNMFAVGGMTPFLGARHSKGMETVVNAVTHYAPDVVIMMFKYQDDILEVPLSYPLTDDPVVRLFESTLDILSNKTGTILINQDHFQAPEFNIWKFAQSTSLQIPKDYSFDKKYRDEIFGNMHIRWTAIRCSKCVLMDMWPAFCTNHRCSTLDPTGNVPLFGDPDHVNLFGSYMMTPLFKPYFQHANLTNTVV